MTTRSSRALDELVAGLDPEAGRGKVPLDRRALSDLAEILHGSTSPTAPPPRVAAPSLARARWKLAVPVAAALAVLLVVVWPSFGPGDTGVAQAATPTPLTYQALPGGSDPRELLEQIAARTARLPDDTGSGPYAHLLSRGWNLFTSVDGRRVTSKVVPQLTESWISADGAGRSVTTIEEPGKRPRRAEQRNDPGGLAGTRDLTSLSSDDRVLAEQLAQGHPDQNGPAERLVAIKDTYGQVPVPPPVRAGLLRYLAQTPTLTATGTVTDRAGRPGVAFSLDSDYSGLPTRYTVIIDPDTGKLLATEDTLTSSAGRLNVPIPSVIGYTTYLEADYTDRTG